MINSIYRGNVSYETQEEINNPKSRKNEQSPFFPRDEKRRIC